MLITVFFLLLVWSVCDDYIINTHFLKENSYAFPNKLIQSFPKLKVLACVTPHWFISETPLEGGEEEREAGGQTTLPLSPPLSGFVQENPTQSLPLCCVFGLEQGNERQMSLFPSNTVSFLYDCLCLLLLLSEAFVPRFPQSYLFSVFQVFSQEAFIPSY